MGLAARYGQTWVTTGDLAPEGKPLTTAAGVAVVRAQMALLDDACSAASRDLGSIARLVLTGPRLDPGLSSLGAFEDAGGRYEEAGVTDFVVHWPRPDEPYAADPATFERIFTEVASRR
jgi:hypothetical protein